ncbi:MAG: 2-amino-4-hydroxy-6-hydroxymethyldihydropteridine diphosphokinase [Hyphomonadaceae bacterium]
MPVKHNSVRRVLVAMGTNMPHGPLSGPVLLAAAAAEIARLPVTVLTRSNIWETAPWPPSAQAHYFNAVIALNWPSDAPDDMFNQLRAIEKQFGRERRERWGPRTLDLDLLDVGGETGVFDDITLPHPRLAERAFVLAPLAEAAPEWRHPITGAGIQGLLESLPEGQAVRRWGPFPPL